MDVVNSPELKLDVRVESLVLVTFARRPVCHRVDLTAFNHQTTKLYQYSSAMNIHLLPVQSCEH